MKALLIDPDGDVVDLLTQVLGSEGFAVIATSDRQEGLRRWIVEHPDVVLLDVTSPSGADFDLCRQIRESSTTPIILLSAGGEDRQIVESLEAGADDYVMKPLSSAVLAARLAAVMRPYRALQALAEAQPPRSAAMARK